MPNYVENDLYVTGTKKDIVKLKKFVNSKEQIFDFDKIIPYPNKFKERDENVYRIFELERKDKKTAKEEKELMALKLITKAEFEKDGYNFGGYDWCVTNWGTKWNAGNCQRWACKHIFETEDREQHKITFDTAWSSPIPVVEALAKKFVSIEFELRYFEHGNEFNGVAIWKNGKLIRSDTGRYFGDRGG